MLQQVLVTLIGFLGRGKAGELAHGEKLAAVSGGVNAARIRRLAGVAEVLRVVPIFGKVGLGIEAADGDTRDCGEASVTFTVHVDPGGSANGPFGRLLQRWGERLFGPVLLRVRRMASLENVRNRNFRD